MPLGKKYRFVIPGPPVGHTATTHKGKFQARYRKYARYAKDVRMLAEAAGLPLPLSADAENQVMVNVYSYFENGTHPDPENVRKGIADALAYDTARRRKGDDKHFGGLFTPPRYDKEFPRAVVIVKDYRRKNKKRKTS